MESIRGRLLKIKALAENGYEGEAKAARHLLEKVLEKHNMTFEDLAQEELKKREFRVPRDMNYLFAHVVAQIIGAKRARKITYYTNKPSMKYCEVTDLEYLEIANMFDFHFRQLKKEIEKQKKLTTTAYIYKHKLTVDDGRVSDSSSTNTKDLLTIVSLMKNMDNVYYRKQLKK